VSYPFVNSSTLQTFTGETGNFDYTTAWSLGSGNTLVVAYTYVDTAGNNYNPASFYDNAESDYMTTDVQYNWAFQFTLGFYSVVGTASGTHDITINPGNTSPNVNMYLMAFELQGLCPFDYLLGSNSQTSNTAHPSLTGAAPTGAQNDVQFNVCQLTITGNNPGSYPAVAGYTGLAVSTGGSSYPPSGFCYAVSSSAAGTVAWGDQASPDWFGNILAGYKAPALPAARPRGVKKRSIVVPVAIHR